MRRTPALDLAAIAVFAACIAASLVAAASGELHPGVETVERDDATVVTRVFPNGRGWDAGFHEGDVVIGEADLRQALSTQDPEAVFTVTRADGTVVDGVSIATKSIITWTQTLALSLAGLLFMASAVAVWRRARGGRVPVLYLALGLTAGCALALSPATAFGWPLALAIEMVWLVLVGPAFLTFFAAFPVDRLKAPTVRVLLAAQYMVSTAALATYMASVLGPSDAYVLAQQLIYLSLGLAISGGVALAGAALVRPPDPTRREQMRIIAVGTAVAVLPFILLSILPRVARLGELVPPETSVLAAGILPLAFSYAIMRYQLMGIRRLVHRGVVYFTIAVFIVVAYGLFIFARQVYLPQFATRIDFILASDFVFLILAIMAFQPLLGGARRFVDRVLYRDAYDYRTTLESLSAQASTFENVDALVESTLHELKRILSLRKAVIVLSDQGRPRVAENADPDLDADVARDIASEAVNTMMGDRHHVVRELPDEQGQVLFVQLVIHGQLVGAMALGPKTTGEPFRPDDVSLITTFAHQLAAVIENARLVRELRARLKELELSASRLTQSREQLRQLNIRIVKATEDERKRIAIDLHDGPLQDVYALARNLELVKGAEECYVMARQVATELREFSSRLRPAILDDLGLLPSLEWLTARVAERSGISVTLDCHGMVGDSRLPPEVETTLFRVTQESLSNCVNHSGSKTASVTLERRNGSIQLRIKDNGRGFNSDAYLASPKPGHMGLVGMSERLYQVGGVLEVESQPGKGTEVRAELPVEGFIDASNSSSN